VGVWKISSLSHSALCRGSSGVWILGTSPRMTLLLVSRPACGTQAGPRNKSGAQKRMSQTSTRSGMTVGEKRESCAGTQACPHPPTACAAEGLFAPARDCDARRACPPMRRRLAQARLRELNETSRKHGPLNLAPLFYVIGAQSSGPSGGDCTLPRSPGLVSGRTALLGLRFVSLTRAHVPPVRSPLRWGGLTGRRVVTLASPPARKKIPSEPPRMLPVRKHQGCAVRPDSSGGRCRVPVRSDTGRYSRTSFTKPSGLTSRMETHGIYLMVLLTGVHCLGPCRGNWCRISWRGIVGWTHMRYLGE
jgi:hypothetical protein